MSTIHYDEFKNAFLKTAKDQGYDPTFLSGVMKHAEEQYQGWVYLIEKAAARSGNPNFRRDCADELLFTCGLMSPTEKRAADEGGTPAPAGFNWQDLGQQITGLMDSFGKNLGNTFNQPDAGGGLGGMALGGGGGLILGFLLHQLTGMPLSAAMALGGLGGGGLGAYLGGTPHGRSLLGTGDNAGAPLSSVNPGASEPQAPTAEQDQQIGAFKNKNVSQPGTVDQAAAPSEATPGVVTPANPVPPIPAPTAPITAPNPASTAPNPAPNAAMPKLNSSSAVIPPNPQSPIKK